MEAVLNTRLLARGARVGVAVSGGADSIALLSLLHEKARYELTVLHVNHGLRGTESEGDEEFVRNFAGKLGIGVLVHPAVLESGNMEAAGRKARYGWFRELLSKGTVNLVATGHTASDQAETVLFRFLRGAGSGGLAAVRPEADGIVRPLLGWTREQVCRYLTERGISWREDSSNRDVTFARNRIRHELLPALTRDWNPALQEVLCHTAEWARGEEEYWARETPRLAAQCVTCRDGAVLVSCAELTALPLAAARRVVRFAIGAVRGDLAGVDFAHIERFLQLASKGEGCGRLQIAGVAICRSFDWVRLSRDVIEEPGYREELRIPCQIALGSGPRLQLELKNTDSVYNTDRHQLDWGRLTGSLELRNWHPGDHYKQAGHASEIKLKHLFQKARIPLWERHRWPVITHNSTIVWTREFGAAEGFLPRQGAGMVVAIREVPGDGNEKRIRMRGRDVYPV